MTNSISATFPTRRDAEMAVEHLIQEHGLHADSVEIVPESTQNSAGTKLSGGDRDGSSQSGSPDLGGNLVVTVRADTAHEEAVRSSFAAYGGRPIGDVSPS